MFRVIAFFALVRLLLVFGAPTASQNDLRHGNLRARQNTQESLPVVNLPYVAQRAYSYDPLRDVSSTVPIMLNILTETVQKIYVFKNFVIKEKQKSETKRDTAL